MGPYKSLKEVRRIVLDCMKNIHPIYRIKVSMLYILFLYFSFIHSFMIFKELMIRRELAKDPKLATESWDRFLPQFRKRHLKTSEKTAKKNEKIVQKVEARKAAGLETTVEELTRKEATKKKVYTPFPPAQLPRKVRTTRSLFDFWNLTFHFSISFFYIGRFTIGIGRIFPQSFGERSQRGGEEKTKGTCMTQRLDFFFFFRKMAYFY